MLLSVSSAQRLRRLIEALQALIDRHDILRTAVLWEQLPLPVQVVQRRATLRVEELVLDGCTDPIEQLKQRMRPDAQTIDVRRAPLMRLEVAVDAGGDRRFVLLRTHHLVFDNESLQALLTELGAHLEGRAHELPEPQPYRIHVAQVLRRTDAQDAEAFFRSRLGRVEGPTAPFGVLDVHGDGTALLAARERLEPALAQRLRAQGRRLGVSAATLWHAAWALVLSRTTARDDVVFGTVLAGRLHRAADARRMLGMLINTLPLCLQLGGLSAQQLVEHTQRELTELLAHEQASLTLAQRCSGVGASTPLFSSLLNCLHGVGTAEYDSLGAAGVEVLATHGGTNYPASLSVNDQGEAIELAMQTDRRIDPHQMLGYVHTAVEALVRALEEAPHEPALRLPVQPAEELHQLIRKFNATEREYPKEHLIHELFEEQVRRTPEAVAVLAEGDSLSYLQLNRRANQLARYLRDQGVEIGEYIPVAAPRCLAMLVAQLAVLKCGAVFVPVDPTLPQARQLFMIRDCRARRVLVHQNVPAAFEGESLQCLDYSQLAALIETLPADDLELPRGEHAAACVMYTSGSTGTPKGVVIAHRAVIRLIINNGYAQLEPTDRIAHCSNPAFDASIFEVWGALLHGASLEPISKLFEQDA